MDKVKLTKSEARRKYWASISPEKRSAHARNAAKKKAMKMTVEEKRKHAMLMVEARKK